MYHFNGTAWVRLTAPNTIGTANFHGINSTSTSTHCSVSSPVSSTCKIGIYQEDEKPQLIPTSKTGRRAPLKQLYPRTPTPFKKAYADAVRKGGHVEQLDLQKSPELFEDLQEIIYKDVVLPPAKRIRRPVYDQQPSVTATADHPTTSHSSTSACNISVRYHTPKKDTILDTTCTPSKVLNDSSFLMSPPFQADITGPIESTPPSRTVSSNVSEIVHFVEPPIPPRPFSAAWFRIACGRTSAQCEMTSMAKDRLRNSSSSGLSFL